MEDEMPVLQIDHDAAMVSGIGFETEQELAEELALHREKVVTALVNDFEQKAEEMRRLCLIEATDVRVGALMAFETSVNIALAARDAK